MYVVDNSVYKKKAFSDIVGGDVFSHDGEFYVRLKSPTGASVNLNDGDTVSFGKTAIVIAHPYATLYSDGTPG